jgi:RNA polymerase sigma factor (sigma-70 family)
VATNNTIVRELRERDRLGCVHLVDAFQARLIGEAVSLFHVALEDAEELVSDVLLNVVKNIDAFQFKRSESDFTSWVVTIFRNRMRDFVRHQAKSDGLVQRFEESELEADETYSGTARDVVAMIVRNYEEAIRRSDGGDARVRNDGEISEKLIAIADALDRLESWERVLVRCRALEVPYEDIAKYTDKPVAQLKVYHARVKKKFVKLLAETYPELLHHEERTS